MENTEKDLLSPICITFMHVVESSPNLQMKKSGKNFLGIINDIKRRPEDVAKELRKLVYL